MQIEDWDDFIRWPSYSGEGAGAMASGKYAQVALANIYMVQSKADAS